jgi:hypothetical protein
MTRRALIQETGRRPKSIKEAKGENNCGIAPGVPNTNSHLVVAVMGPLNAAFEQYGKPKHHAFRRKWLLKIREYPCTI